MISPNELTHSGAPEPRGSPSIQTIYNVSEPRAQHPTEQKRAPRPAGVTWCRSKEPELRSRNGSGQKSIGRGKTNECSPERTLFCHPNKQTRHRHTEVPPRGRPAYGGAPLPRARPPRGAPPRPPPRALALARAPSPARPRALAGDLKNVHVRVLPPLTPISQEGYVPVNHPCNHVFPTECFASVDFTPNGVAQATPLVAN